MQDDAARDAVAPGTPVSPDGQAALAAVPPSYLPGKTNPAPPAGSPGSALPSLPGIPATPVPPSSPVPQTSVPSFTPSPVTPSPSSPTPASPSSTTTTPSTTSTTPTTTTPEEDRGGDDGEDDQTPAQLAAFDLTDATPASYDPSDKAPDADPTRAFDGDPGTSWTIPTTAGDDPQVGLLVTLPERKRVRRLRFTTKTPGFRAEVYVTDTSGIPPQITDTRWTRGPDVRSADEGQNEYRFGGNGQVTRSLVIWVTRAAAQGDRVTIDDVELLGEE